MKEKWYPCICTAVMGVLVILFTWWQLSWSRWALTILGVLVILKGIINRCCCGEKMMECCKDEIAKEMKKEGGTGGGGCCN